MGFSCFLLSHCRIDTFGKLKQILPAWREEMKNPTLFKVWLFWLFLSHSPSTIISFSIPVKRRLTECERDFTQTALFFSGECCLVSKLPFSLPILRLSSLNVLAKRGSTMMSGRWASCYSNSSRALPMPPPSNVKSVPLYFPLSFLTFAGYWPPLILRFLQSHSIVCSLKHPSHSNCSFLHLFFLLLLLRLRLLIVMNMHTTEIATQPGIHNLPITPLLSLLPLRRDVRCYAARSCSTQWVEPPTQRRWIPE